MAFTPIRLTSPAGKSVLVGSATEREHLLAHGYSIEQPAPAPAVEEPATASPADDDKPAVDEKPAPVNVTRKTTSK